MNETLSFEVGSTLDLKENIQVFELGALSIPDEQDDIQVWYSRDEEGAPLIGGQDLIDFVGLEEPILFQWTDSGSKLAL